MLCEIVNNELREVCNWFKANKLSLNAKKTNLMFLGTRFQTKQIDDRSIVCLDGCKLYLYLYRLLQQNGNPHPAIEFWASAGAR